MPLSPQRMRRPRVPAVPLRGRAFEVEGRELKPLVGPEIPIPGNQDDDLLAEFEVWRLTTNGSLPEFIVWKFLTEEKKQRPGIDFIFQFPLLGGRTRFGGFILDYYFPLKSEGWRVQGERFHREQPADRARDAISKAILTARGLKLIDLWEDDLLTRDRFVLNLAWERGASVPTRLNL